LDTTSTSRPLVSVVAPVFNEQTALPELVARLGRVATTLADAYRFEFVLVDDGSSDESLAVARQLTQSESRLRVIELRRNYGQTAALQAGLDRARGAILISMDADLQHLPEDIPRFLDAIRRGDEVVCGWRYERQDSIIRRWPSSVANYLLRQISGLTIHDIGTTYRAYKADIARDFRLLGEGHRFVPIFAARAGARIGELKIENPVRTGGVSKYGLSRTMNVFVDLFFVAFYALYLDRPIRLFGRAAVIALAVALLITAGLASEFVRTGAPVVRQSSGWFMLGLVMYVTAGQFIFFGIVCELLVRIYFQSDRYASYHVRQEWSQSRHTPELTPTE
jgi:glycosyltransferase involved in cell wall biosynthesis